MLSNVGASQTKLRELGIFPNKHSKLSFARYKPIASDVWSDLLKDPDQGSGLPSPKKEIYLTVQEYSSCPGEESQVRFNDFEFPGLFSRGFIGQSYQLSEVG